MNVTTQDQATRHDQRTQEVTHVVQIATMRGKDIRDSFKYRTIKILFVWLTNEGGGFRFPAFSHFGTVNSPFCLKDKQ